MIDPYILWVGVIAAGVGGGTYALTMRDLVRRGRLHRRGEELLRRGETRELPEGRIPCPECAEAILPAARRCPFCRHPVSR
jgi:hypothetical protein